MKAPLFKLLTNLFRESGTAILPQSKTVFNRNHKYIETVNLAYKRNVYSHFSIRPFLVNLHFIFEPIFDCYKPTMLHLLKPFFTSVTTVLIFLCLSPTLTQAQTPSSNNQDVLGHGFDVRYIDALDWGASSKGKLLFKGGATTYFVQESPVTTHHFVTTPYEFEQELLRADTIASPFQGINSKAHYKSFENDGSDKLLFVYTQKRMPLTRKSLKSQKTKTLDSALVADFSRIGRDITAHGFVHRYGTHYATQVVYGGVFLQRNFIDNSNFVYSPYLEDEFKEKVVQEIESRSRGLSERDEYLNVGEATHFTVGGDTKQPWLNTWEPTVASNLQPIEVSLQTFSKLFSTVALPDVEDKIQKINALDSVIEAATAYAQTRVQREVASQYYKKFSLRFKQELTKIVKKNMGRDTNDSNAYTGDIFFGGFSKDDAILDIQPLIETGGLRLETLITDEVVDPNRMVTITAKPDDLKTGYFSVWDDTKKLAKSDDRKTLRVSGTEEAKTRFQEILKGPIEKTIELETIDKDTYEITYVATLVKDDKAFQNTNTDLNYVLGTELVAAAATGDIPQLTKLFEQNANPNTAGIVKTIVTNKLSNEVLNFVLDNGVPATTEDLELVFEPDFYEREKALILLERGATPKNNMIYKAVAYQDSDVIYALFREGAVPRNNDLAFALRNYHYPTIKALMDEDFQEFVAGKNELLLATENNDADLAQKFITLGATADAYILDKALEQDNEALRNVIVPVTETSSAALDVAAKRDDTTLFEYFISKNAQLETPDAVIAATDNDNLKILDLALKNGGKPEEAIAYAIKEDKKEAITVALKNKAISDPVFAYAAQKEDYTLFNEALTIYGGNPEIALQEAVNQNRIQMAEQVIETFPSKISTSENVEVAVVNDNLKMVQLLVNNTADPNRGMQKAISSENTAITEFLISKGAETVNPEYIKEAVKKENFELSKLLIEKGDANVSDAIVEAANSGNIEITKYLLDKGATSADALSKAMNTKNEDIILLLLEKTPKLDLEPEMLSTAARKGNLEVIKWLLSNNIQTEYALTDAIRYKHLEVANYLINDGFEPTSEHLEIAVNSNFTDGIKLLLENGVGANSNFEDGEFALHKISASYEEEDLKIIKLLLDNGASIDVKNSNGETPLHLAALGNEAMQPLIEYLLINGADPTAKTIKGITPEAYALNKELKSLLKKAAKKKRKG